MLNVESDNMLTELKADVDFRDKHIKQGDELLNWYMGSYYRTDKKAATNITTNHAYEYISVVKPMIIYDTPRCIVQALNGGQMGQEGVLTGHDVATAIGLSLNRWAQDSRLSRVLSEIAYDFFFLWGVGMMTTINHPGYQGTELMPRLPYAMRIAPHHFILDRYASSNDVFATDGPRYKGHMWKADYADLAKDPKVDKKALDDMHEDTDREMYWGDTKNLPDAPTRGEVMAWDIWVPEVQTSKEKGFNGTLYTYAVGQQGKQTTKKMRQIMEPRPAFVPPWGPYTLFGANLVPNSPYPMSDLIATAEQAHEVNAHTTAAAKDAAAHKSFIAAAKSNPDDAELVKTVRHGDVVLLDDVDNIKPIEVGGVTESQYKYNEYAGHRLNRSSGITDAMLGEITTNATATESSIAQGGSSVRVDGKKREFRGAVQEMFMGGSWYIFHSDDMVFSFGNEGKKAGLAFFYSGDIDRDTFDFYDISLTIDPLSMEHTGQAVYQRRVQVAFDTLIKAVPSMIQAPFIEWKEPMRRLFESLNIMDADKWIDDQMLQQMSMMASGMSPAAAGPGGAPQNPGIPEHVMAAMGTGREMGSMAGAASTGAL